MVKSVSNRYAAFARGREPARNLLKHGRMRILLATNLFPPDVLGGYELLAADVANALRSRGHDVQVVTTGQSRSTDPDWVHRPLTLVRDFSAPASLDRFRHVLAAKQQVEASSALLATGFDAALIMSMRRLGLHVPRALRTRGIPAVYCFNDDWLLAHQPAAGATPTRRAAWRIIERVGFGARTWKGVAIDRAVYVSDSIRTALRRGGANVPDGVVCFQGVDRKTFSARAPRAMNAAPKVLYVGRIHPTKGVDVAIRALGIARDRGLDATLTIVGTGADEELARLRAIAEETKVTDRVEWRGFVDRASLGAVYQAHDVFVFPSLWDEPAGLTYLEAMACGVPVVAIARGGAKELLVHESNALVCDDAASVGAALVRLASDATLAERLVAGGERTVEERASLARYVDVIEAELTHAARRAA